jgi:Fur family transcriptional regulator, zinc uptake regulator
MKPTSLSNDFASAEHDHDRCISEAVATAATLCKRRDVRLTDLRRRVLELVWRAHDPIGAYALLELLRQDGRSAAPPTVYRALDFLLEQGFVHRVESLNAYVGCVQPGEPHVCQYLICRGCGLAQELNDRRITAVITAAAQEKDFEVRSQTIEVMGLCGRCHREIAGGDAL